MYSFHLAKYSLEMIAWPCILCSHLEQNQPCVHSVLNAMYLYFQLSVAYTDDWTRFARTLMEIRANRADGEEEGPMELAS